MTVQATRFTINKLFQSANPYNILKDLFENTELEPEDFFKGEESMKILELMGLKGVVWLSVIILYENGAESVRPRDVQNYLSENLQNHIPEKFRGQISDATIRSKLLELEKEKIIEAVGKYPRCSYYKPLVSFVVETIKY